MRIRPEPTASRTPSTWPGEFRGDVQGLRAIAVLAVVLYHAKVSLVTGGYVGVDIFFVISGFLITGRLARELATGGHIRFAEFYARRARRLLPASFAVIVLTVAAALVFQPPLAIGGTLRDAIAAALYVPNVVFALRRQDYLSQAADPSPFEHYWSLGLEEQFYLLWPLLMLIGFVAGGRSRRGMVRLLTALTVLSLALCVFFTPPHPSGAFFLIPTRAWEFGIGGLIAIGLASAPRLLTLRGVGLLGWLGVALIAYAVFSFNALTDFPGWAAAIPVLGTALVILSGAGPSHWSPRRVLSAPPLLFVGLISYSVYLVHWPLMVITQQALTPQQKLPTTTLGLAAAAIPLGWLVYRYVEKPLRQGRAVATHQPGRTLITAAAVSAILAVASTVAIRAIPQRTLDAGFTVGSSPLTLHPRGTPEVPSNLKPALRAALADRAVIYRNGCITYGTVPRICSVGDNPRAPDVALFGDSHAAHFYPAFAALAEAGDIRLDSMVRPSCPSVERPIDESACRVWRSRVVALLNEHPPDIIVLSNSSYPRTDWQPALRSTIPALPSKSRIVVVADTPNMGSTPAICLSAHLRSANDCSRPRRAALNLTNREAERALGVEVLDVTGYMCNEDYCPPIIGDLLVYRDGHHIAAPFAQALAPVVRAQLLPGAPAIP